MDDDTYIHITAHIMDEYTSIHIIYFIFTNLQKERKWSSFSGDVEEAELKDEK